MISKDCKYIYLNKRVHIPIIDRTERQEFLKLFDTEIIKEITIYMDCIIINIGPKIINSCFVSSRIAVCRYHPVLARILMGINPCFDDILMTSISHKILAALKKNDSIIYKGMDRDGQLQLIGRTYVVKYKAFARVPSNLNIYLHISQDELLYVFKMAINNKCFQDITTKIMTCILGSNNDQYT